MTDVLVVIPTYNEAASVSSVVHRVRSLAERPAVLIVDDASPDGTGSIADRLAAADHDVHVIHRRGKAGLGPAYIAGFTWGISRGYEVICQLDADGSHQPEQLPELISPIRRGADLVIGSRWVSGGAIVNWPWHRVLISRAGTRYARWALQLTIHDVTAGFRVWRAGSLSAIDVETASSQGYCFQIDLTRRAMRAGLAVSETPITFIEREQGRSKMTPRIVVEAVWRVTAWGLQRLAGR